MMKRSIAISAKLTALAAVTGLALGCASTQELDEIRSIAEEAQRTAQQAENTANAAQSTAQEAQETAAQAQDAADRAHRLAEDAQQCCRANEEKIDRMFEKSQQK